MTPFLPYTKRGNTHLSQHSGYPAGGGWRQEGVQGGLLGCCNALFPALGAACLCVLGEVMESRSYAMCTFVHVSSGHESREE